MNLLSKENLEESFQNFFFFQNLPSLDPWSGPPQPWPVDRLNLSLTWWGYLGLGSGCKALVCVQVGDHCGSAQGPLWGIGKMAFGVLRDIHRSLLEAILKMFATQRRAIRCQSGNRRACGESASGRLVEDIVHMSLESSRAAPWLS